VEFDLAVFFDGGCKSNPGDLAVAAVACSPDGRVLVKSARPAGQGSSNVAEYRALAHAICVARLLGARRPLFASDSALVVQQINGFWAMRGNEALKYEHARCASGLMEFQRWMLKHIPREQNKLADWLVSSLLGHGRALKNEPTVVLVSAEGNGRPGWAEL
jgi:ribonuclease HI